MSAADRPAEFRGHGILDRMSAGINELWCICGTRLWPECDMSAASICDCFEEHLSIATGLSPEAVERLLA